MCKPDDNRKTTKREVRLVENNPRRGSSNLKIFHPNSGIVNPILTQGIKQEKN